MALNLTTKKEDACITVSLDGELNTMTAPELKELAAKQGREFTDAQLRVVALPHNPYAEVFLLAEVTDSVSPSLYLCTMRRSHRLIDILCVYEQKRDDRLDECENFCHQHGEQFEHFDLFDLPEHCLHHQQQGDQH